MSQRRGCWVAISRCFGGKPQDERALFNRSATERIEFESLSTAEERAEMVLKGKQVVTEQEREHVMSGNLGQLVDEQRRIDLEREAELRRQEEALRLEEEAYFAAKREASKRRQGSYQTLTVANEQLPVVSLSFPTPTQPSTTLSPPPHTAPTITGRGNLGSSTLPPWLADIKLEPGSTRRKEEEEEEFDEFLESVKARQTSVTTKPTTVEPSAAQQKLMVSDTEDDDVDFGFWEKAPLPPSHVTTLPPSHPPPPPHTTSTTLPPSQSVEEPASHSSSKTEPRAIRELDLNLL